MRVRIDQGADAVYLTLSDVAVENSEEVSDGIVLDFDAAGRVVGIEILEASSRTGNAAVLKDFSFELPPRRLSITVVRTQARQGSRWAGGQGHACPAYPLISAISITSAPRWSRM